jgi:hypothetical protein
MDVEPVQLAPSSQPFDLTLPPLCFRWRLRRERVVYRLDEYMVAVMDVTPVSDKRTQAEGLDSRADDLNSCPVCF